MLNAINKGIAKIFGTKSERDIKEVMPYVQLINEEYSKLTNISDDELRGKTDGFKEHIGEKLHHIDSKLEELHTKVAEDKSMEISEKDEIFKEIDRLEEKRDEELEEVLLDILPQALVLQGHR